MKIVALMGEAGSGKDTILHKLIEQYPAYFNEIISCTTRPPREGEKNGVNYYFLSIDEFTQKVLNGDMIEATEFNDWHYGTMASSLSIDKVNIGVFNPEGIRCLQEYSDVELMVFYVRARDKERLLRQLNREQDPDVEEIVRRYRTDKLDFDGIDDIKYFEITNNSKEDINKAISIIMDKCY